MTKGEDGHVVARIGKPHGLRGEVTVQVHTDDPQSRFVPGTPFVTRAEPGSGVPRTLTLATARLHRAIWLLGFEEVPDRTGAEGLRGTRLLLDVGTETAGTAEDDEDGDDEGYYPEDLIGLTVLDPAGRVLGEVLDLEVAPAQDRLHLRLSGGSPAMVPFVAAIVPEVDLERGSVVVDAPPGLLELGRDEG